MYTQDYRIRPYAALQMRRRGITEDLVARAFFAPERVVPGHQGRVVLQTRVALGHPEKTYIVRVVVDADRRPPEVVTVYLTSKLAKYGGATP